MSELLSPPAGYRFPRQVIAVAVRWLLRYGLSYRDGAGIRRPGHPLRPALFVGDRYQFVPAHGSTLVEQAFDEQR
jgi:hypothetical protein